LLTLYSRYESYIDVEIQQRAVEYFELSRKGSALADVLAEMPKFPEREVTYMTDYSCRQLGPGNLTFFLIIIERRSSPACSRKRKLALPTITSIVIF